MIWLSNDFMMLWWNIIWFILSIRSLLGSKGVKMIFVGKTIGNRKIAIIYFWAKPCPKGEPLAPRLGGTATRLLNRDRTPLVPDPFFSFLPPFCPVTFKDPTDVPARQLFACYSFIVFVNNSLCLFACHSFIVFVNNFFGSLILYVTCKCCSFCYVTQIR